MTELHHLTLAELNEGLRARRFSSVELTRHFLARIERLNKPLNALITVTAEQALAAAQRADAQLAAGEAGSLAGLPIVHKDIFCTDGVLTTCGSRMLSNFVAPYDATIVEKLSQSGVVMLGKANMDEFAMGSSNETSWYGPVKNPWDLKKVPGGSSGGSAAVVAARLAPVATATDTGGSIRQPAALTGLTGFKPTYGRVSRYGMIAFASSLDQAGTLTLSAKDAALVMREMAGFDPRDSTSVDTPVPDYVGALDQPLTGLKIGLLKEFFDGLEAQMATVIREALRVYERLGAKLIEVSLPNLPLSVPTYYVVAPAECSSNLSRFDGVRFGHRCEQPKDLLDLYKRSRGEGFGEEVKRRIMTGTYVLSAGYYDAYYLRAQKVRRLITDDFARAFKRSRRVDGADVADAGVRYRRQGRRSHHHVLERHLHHRRQSRRLAGDVDSLRQGAAGRQQLPVGLQIIGPHFSEAKLLNVAHGYQNETLWHRDIPKGYE